MHILRTIYHNWLGLELLGGIYDYKNFHITMAMPLSPERLRFKFGALNTLLLVFPVRNVSDSEEVHGKHCGILRSETLLDSSMRRLPLPQKTFLC